MKKFLLPIAASLGLVAGCATQGPRLASGASAAPPASADFGVLVMAHGGNETWNREVEAALAPLDRELPLEIAFGMADATSLQAAADRLAARDVARVAVVRLFVSGESWYERTEQILALRPGAPERPRELPHDANAHGGAHGAHAMAYWRVESDARFALSRDGLMDAVETGEVLAERARALSREPGREDVLILAHGPADDGENQRWLEKLDARADAVRRALPFRRVRVETLREDWPEKREAAQARIRGFVADARAAGARAIVIPFRVQGFGPYAKVLEGLEYASDGRGLVPHPAVVQWVRRQALALRDGALADADGSGPRERTHAAGR